MKAFATLIDEIEQELQDTSNAIWSAAELAIQLEDAIREVSEYEPYIVKETFTIESRTGSDTAGATDKLTDDSNDQFVSGDVDKVVYNKTDKTWAVITAYDDTETLSISKDIMADGEEYAIFNKGCSNSKQINLEDVTDWIGHRVIAVEYPIGKRRNFEVEGDILTIDIDFEPDDSADTDADKEVYVWFEKRQRVSQLTDLAGEIDLVAGYSAGDTSIHVDGLQDTGTFGEDTLLTIEGCRGTYRVTADATIASNECDLTIWPGLESDIDDGADVTIKGSTLNTELERLVVELTAARATRSKAIDYINVVNVGGANIARDFDSWGERKLGIVLSKLTSLRNRRAPRASHTYSKLND